MARVYRSFRVFVSSTFADLVAERDALRRHVFPRLEEECRQRGARFQAVDLRWGVSEEDHGAILVERALAALAASRYGLTEEELLGVLSTDADVMNDFRRRSPESPESDRLPWVIWSRLYHDLEPYLTERREGHRERIAAVAISPDGRRVVSRSRDRVMRLWDCESSVAKEELAGITDVDALADGSEQFPWRAISGALETVLQSSGDGKPIGWFPLAADRIATHPGGRLWACSRGNRLTLVVLEGKV